MTARHPIIAELTVHRMAAGHTQAEIAELLAVSQSTVTTWETGTRTPRVEHLAAYADVFGFDIALVEREETP